MSYNIYNKNTYTEMAHSQKTIFSTTTAILHKVSCTIPPLKNPTKHVDVHAVDDLR